MSDIANRAFEAYEAVVASSGDFSPRPGQRQMAQLVASVMSRGTLDRAEKEQESAIAVIDAGTGVGKSLGACVPAIAAALERKVRVIVSTATVNLQEQLISKDLPRFRELMGKDFKFALGKGRSRYVCKVKLARQAGDGGAGDESDFFADDMEPSRAAAGASESVITLYRELQKDLQSGAWDGERDSLTTSADELRWPAIAADHQSCTGKNCQLRASCTYFEARKKLVDADVIVVNHDLLLASLETNLLPKLDESLLVLDEAHELPEIASSQFTYSAELSNLRWLNQVGQRVGKVGKAIEFAETKATVELVSRLIQSIQDLQELLVSMYGALLQTTDKTARLQHGVLPAQLGEPMGLVSSQGKALGKALGEMAAIIKDKLEAGPNTELTQMYAALGAHVPRLDQLVGCMELMLRQPQGRGATEKPDAKWFRFDDESGYIQITANACPQVAGDMLQTIFWPHVRSAVLTSATICTLGRFDYFLQSVGLEGNPNVETLAVKSSFNYSEQGKLTVVAMRAHTKDFDAYNREVAGEMIADIVEVRHGALALFTSRAHMQMTYDAMPEELRERVLLQGSMSRGRLLAEHRRRVDEGQACTILGLQSFGQGVDLPGIYCEKVFIAKLPFTPPTDPVGQARAEWLRRIGRDPFAELAVPAVGIKLTQWTGRLIRSESDTGTIFCYDKRLVQTEYGRQIRLSLPPYATLVREGGVLRKIGQA